MSRPDDPWFGSSPVVGTGWVQQAEDVETDGEHAFGTSEFARYREDRPLGEGGMGRVVAAWDHRLRRTVAVKLAAPGSAAEARLAQEAWITSQLEHPGVVPVYDAGLTEDGRRYVVMRLIRGQTLRQLMDASAPPRLDLIPALRKVCEAVAYAHAAGIVHRDLTPSNVLVGAFGEVQVADWGLARPTSDASGLGWSAEVLPTSDQAHTIAGVVLGTPGYMSPEQAVGAAVDPRADVWGLGALLYEILTGVAPHGHLPGGERQRAIATLDVPDARELVASAPEALSVLAAKALSRDPTKRPPDAGAFLAGLVDDVVPVGRRGAMGVWGLGALALVALVGWAGARVSPVDSDATARWRLSEAMRASEHRAVPEAEVLAAASLGVVDTPAARGLLAGLRSGTRPKLVSSVPLPDSCEYAAVASNGEVACASNSFVYLYGTDGAELWRASMPMAAVGVAIADDVVVVSFFDKRMFAVRRSDGSGVGRGVSRTDAWFGGDDGEAVWVVGRENFSRLDRLGPARSEVEIPIGDGMGRPQATTDLAGGTLLAFNGTATWSHDGIGWKEVGDVPVVADADVVRWVRAVDGGTRVLFATWEGFVGVWDPTEPLASLELVKVADGIRDVDWTPEGEMFAVIDDAGTTVVVDGQTFERVAQLPGAGVLSARWTGPTSLSVAGDGLAVWSLEERSWPASQRISTGVAAVDVRADRLAVAAAGVAVVRDRVGHELWARRVDRNTVKRAVLDAGGTRVAVAGMGINGAEVHDLTTGEGRAIPGMAVASMRRLAWLGEDALIGVSYVRDGPYLARADGSGQVPGYILYSVMLRDLVVRTGVDEAWSLGEDNGLVRSSLAMGGSELAGQAPADAQFLALDAAGQPWAILNDGVAHLDPSTGSAVSRLDVGRDVSALWVLESGDVATGHESGWLRVWSEDGTLRMEVQAHQDRLSTITEYDGLLFTGGWDGFVRTWTLDAMTLSAGALAQDAAATWALDVEDAASWGR